MNAIIKMLKIFRMIKKIDPSLIWRGYTLKDKFKVILSFFFLGPIRKMGISKKEILITMKSEDGLLICGDKSINAANPNYEKSIKKFFDMREGVFIDIGANLGRYTLLMARKLKNCGRVISIEPESNNVEILKKNVEINNLKNVIVVGKACSSKNGKSTLYLEGTKYSGGLHSLKRDGCHVDKKIIEVEKLDSIVSRLGIKEVGLIKIDVEGSEIDVLFGAKKILKNYHPKIICESLNEESEKGITNLLKRYKYCVERVDNTNVFAY